MRQNLLTCRFYSLPLSLNEKPRADVYLSLNDPNSFMLLQVLLNIENRFNIHFNLYLVSETTSSSKVSVTLLKQCMLNDANFTAEKYNLTKVDTYPEAKNLITGQQSWLLSVKSISDALNVFNDTWFGQYEDDYPLSTPVISAQIKNQRRLYKKGYFAPGAILFCGVWFIGVDRLKDLEKDLEGKGLIKQTKEPTDIENLLPNNNKYIKENKDKNEVFTSFDRSVNNEKINSDCKEAM